MRAKTVSLGQGPSVAKQCKDHLPVVRAGRARSVDLVDVGEIQIQIHILDSLVVAVTTGSQQCGKGDFYLRNFLILGLQCANSQ